MWAQASLGLCVIAEALAAAHLSTGGVLTKPVHQSKRPITRSKTFWDIASPRAAPSCLTSECAAVASKQASKQAIERANGNSNNNIVQTIRAPW
jgi:hypothetical protein